MHRQHVCIVHLLGALSSAWKHPEKCSCSKELIVREETKPSHLANFHYEKLICDMYVHHVSLKIKT